MLGVAHQAYIFTQVNVGVEGNEGITLLPWQNRDASPFDRVCLHHWPETAILQAPIIEKLPHKRAHT
jgi:hypothetical protein